MDYLEKLKDPRWQKKRLEILERDGWRCKSCGNKEVTLHVHHIFYFPKKDPWEINNGFLVTFCEDCHKPHCVNEPCEECGEFNLDENDPQRCEGLGNPPKEIQDCIGTLLNKIFEKDEQGDFFTSIGVIWSMV